MESCGPCHAQVYPPVTLPTIAFSRGHSISFNDIIFSHIRYRGSYHILSGLSSLDQEGPDARQFISYETPENCFREVASTREVYGKKWRNFLWPEIIARFEKHAKVISGALRDSFRAREVFGSFEKRTPGLNFSGLSFAIAQVAWHYWEDHQQVSYDHGS